MAWEQIRPFGSLPAMAAGSATTIGSVIYLFGGAYQYMNGTAYFLDTLYSFHPRTHIVQEISTPSGPSQREMHAATSSNDILYVSV